MIAQVQKVLSEKIKKLCCFDYYCLPLHATEMRSLVVPLWHPEFDSPFGCAASKIFGLALQISAK